jgi:hypothetical protein
MAYFKDAKFLTASSGAEFDAIHTPGAVTPYSGVYRCTGCGQSVTSVQHHPLPPQNHHQHGLLSGPIRWQLVVMSHH